VFKGKILVISIIYLFTAIKVVFSKEHLVEAISVSHQSSHRPSIALLSKCILCHPNCNSEYSICKAEQNRMRREEEASREKRREKEKAKRKRKRRMACPA